MPVTLAAWLVVLLALPQPQSPIDPPLAADVEAALRFAPVSVMDKAVTPPSGDKHDYMSQAPYWWPDPSKPDGLPYIRRDGERNPEIARIADHDNLGRLIRHVATLGRAYEATRNETYAAHAARLLRVWFIEPATRMNPHLEYGQAIPGVTTGRGIGIIETRDLPRLLDGVRKLADSKRWTAADERALQSWMRSYLRWLLDSAHGREEARNGNNHETWYDVQVVGLALYVGDRATARRTLEGASARIARHIEPDGAQPRELERTRSWDYSIFNLTAFFELAGRGEPLGVDLWHYRTNDGRSLRAALQYLLPYASGQQPWPHRQITPFRGEALDPLLRQARTIWGDSK